MIKNYIGFSLDTSASMAHLAHAAMRDYNSQIASIKTAANEGEGVDTIVSVVFNGVGRGMTGARVERHVVNSSLTALRPLDRYVADGGSTPLFDSVGELIDIFKSVPDANDPNVAFLVMAITDGQENSSVKWRNKLADEMRRLSATDRWTFVFRVPRGYAAELSRNFGVPRGNILEWDTTERGLYTASVATNSAIGSYYSGLRSGKRATSGFYTDLSHVDPGTIRATMEEISGEVAIWRVDNGYGDIRSFVESQVGAGRYLKGAAFYELVKHEKAVQDYKTILVREKATGRVFAGPAARQLMGFPPYGTISVNPGDHGAFEIFIQSTSVNRKLPVGSKLAYWPGAVRR